MASLFTEEDHRQFIERGFVFVRGLLPADTVAAALATLDAPAPSEDDGVDRLWQVDDVTAALSSCVPQELVDSVADLFGPGVEFEQIHVLDRPRPYDPEASAGYEPHCDLVYPAILPDTFAISIFIFLTPATPGSGCLHVVDGSPRRLRISACENSSEWANTAARIPALTGPLTECLAQPGDAVFFSHLMVHSASTNRTFQGTRHALDVRFRLARPLAPGGKPFEEMSTLEKANSARYLAECLGDHLTMPRLASGAVAAAQESGFGGTGEVVTSDTIRLGGRVHLFTVEADAPHLVRRRHSDDLAAWVEESPLSLTSGQPVTSLHFEHRYDPTLTLVARTPEGGVRSLVFGPGDGGQSVDDLALLCEYPGVVASRPHFIHEHMSSRAANGRVQLFVPDHDPTVVRWRSREKDLKVERDDWDAEGEVLRAPAAVTDVSVRSIADGAWFALVADLVGGDGRARTAVARTSLSDYVDGALVPLLEEGGAVRNVRVLQRGPGAWLVTYVAVNEGGSRLHLGLLDWGPEQAAIRRLRTSADVDDALFQVGLR